MIVIPMAGKSSRFTKAGYKQPKYMLPIGTQPAFDFAVSSFRRYFDKDTFLFVISNAEGVREFVADRCRELGIKDFRIVTLTADTRGQAETVHIGITDVAGNEPVAIFNIDTFRPDCHLADALGDGYLEVFVGEGDNWSFVEPRDVQTRTVARTAEKEPISDLCCTGLYCFRSKSQFEFAYALELDRLASGKTELYVAPMYNHLIARGNDIRYEVIPRDHVVFCGVPSEYEAITINEKEIRDLADRIFGASPE